MQLSMMSVGHVVPLRLLHMRWLQRWFIRLHIEPVLQRRCMIPLTVCPDFGPLEKSSDSMRGRASGQSLHKLPGRSVLSAVVELHQTAGVLGAHTLTLHQSSVQFQHTEQKGGHYVKGGPLLVLQIRKRFSKADVDLFGTRAVCSLVLTEHTGQSSTG